MIKIAPSILSADFSRLGDEVERVEKAGCDYLHIDVMDGRFVPNITIGPVVIESIRDRSKLPFDVHLMIIEPEKYISQFIHAGADIITVQAETCPHLHRTVYQIRDAGAKACVALNPSTSLSALDHVLEDLDMVLIMTVNPGFGGQSFIPAMVSKIKNLSKKIETLQQKPLLQVDGGINLSNIRAAAEAGARVFVAGSAIYNSSNPDIAVRELKEAASKV